VGRHAALDEPASPLVDYVGTRTRVDPHANLENIEAPQKLTLAQLQARMAIESGKTVSAIAAGPNGGRDLPVTQSDDYSGINLLGSAGPFDFRSMTNPAGQPAIGHRADTYRDPERRRGVQPRVLRVLPVEEPVAEEYSAATEFVATLARRPRPAAQARRSVSPVDDRAAFTAPAAFTAAPFAAPPAFSAPPAFAAPVPDWRDSTSRLPAFTPAFEAAYVAAAFPAPAVNAAIEPAAEMAAVTAGTDLAAIAAPERPKPAVSSKRRSRRKAEPKLIALAEVAVSAEAPAVQTQAVIPIAPRRVRRAMGQRPLMLRTPVLIAAVVVAGTVGAEQASLLNLGSDSAQASNIAMSDPGALAAAAAASAAPAPLVVPQSRADAVAVASEASAAAAAAAAAEAAAAAAAAAAAPSTTSTRVNPPAGAATVQAAAGNASTVTVTAKIAGTWIRPTIGGQMTSCFCTRWGVFHDGIDIDPPFGTPILAVGDGVVVFAGPLSGYGVGIFIQHDNGDVSFYGHESSSMVKVGDKVTAGQQIAKVGNEGYSTGPHLHFGVYKGGKDGPAIDPVPWLLDRGIDVGAYNPNG
jgi:murein DD-endopeptidase MepM/ murein hydrolase activator NlpD